MDFDLGRTIAVLERTPGTLRALLSGHDAAWTERDYGPATWSAKEVVAHLIFGERTDWIPRLRLMLDAHPGVVPTFEPFDRAGHGALFEQHSLETLLDVFERERAANLEILRGLWGDDSVSALRGEHPALGPATAGELLAAWAVHDLNHIAQCAKAMAYQYGAAVGPWAQYLSILSPPNPR